MNKTQSHTESRHETKFVLPNSSSHIISQWLKYRCLPDPEFPAGIVSSIYYDTPDWRFMREKVNSDYLKTKIRLRWYADIDTEEPQGQSYIEAKFKVGSRRQKIRIKTNISGNWLHTAGLERRKLLRVPYLLRSKGVILRGQVVPVFKISYKRRRFVEPTTGARLSLDYDISSPCVNHHVLPRTNPFGLQTAVFELKGILSELPEVLGQLTALGCRKQSFSKYSICYQKIMRI